MIVYPAIDISKGEIVRLIKGDFGKKMIYKKNLEEQVQKPSEKWSFLDTCCRSRWSIIWRK